MTAQEIIQDCLHTDEKFRYMLLDRLKADCKYFLGNSCQCAKHLYMGNVPDQIALMKALWNSLPEKPEWLTMTQIEGFERCMLRPLDYEKIIDGILRSNRIFAEVYTESKTDKEIVIAAEISWGDWKHEHLRADWLVQYYLPALKYSAVDTTEEDGSDCYSAIHRYYFTPNTGN